MKKIIKFPSMKAENREYSEETFESRIHRLARYYKSRRLLDPSWKYSYQTASALTA